MPACSVSRSEGYEGLPLDNIELRDVIVGLEEVRIE